MSYNRPPDKAQWLTPLECVMALIAPLKDLHEVTGGSVKTPYGWRNASTTRDAGQLPPRVAARLLAHADRTRAPLTARHLIAGAPRDEIAQLCRQIGKVPPAPAARPGQGQSSGQVAAE